MSAGEGAPMSTVGGGTLPRRGQLPLPFLPPLAPPEPTRRPVVVVRVPPLAGMTEAQRAQYRVWFARLVLGDEAERKAA